jgi:hypothetical protein
MIPSIQFTEEGLIVPTREEITAGLWDIMRDAFGPDINPDARTPQGQLVTSLTAVIQDRDNASVELGNNFDPRYAIGQFQEALAAIYFLTRKTATKSIAQLEFVGIAGTIIPQGFAMVDDAGIEWLCINSTPLSSDLVEFACAVPGPVQAAPRTIRTFKQTIDGIDRAENPDAAAAGSNEESRANFETRRYNSVAANSKNMNSSVRGSVDNLPGVIDVYVDDNFTDNTVTKGSTNYPMIRNSLLVSVVGGDDQAIAEQIVIKGGTGCSFVGNTTVIWKDTSVPASQPPEYVVKFLRPAHVTVFMRLRVVDPSAISFSSLEAAKSSIISEFQTGSNRARIGGLAVGANFMVGLDVATIRPVSLEMSTDGVSWSEYRQFGVDESPTTSSANISLVGI